MNLVDVENLKKYLIQIKKLTANDLRYKYKGNTADAKFDKFDNALTIINKIKNGEIIQQMQKIIKRNLNRIQQK